MFGPELPLCLLKMCPPPGSARSTRALSTACRSDLDPAPGAWVGLEEISADRLEASEQLVHAAVVLDEDAVARGLLGRQPSANGLACNLTCPLEVGPVRLRRVGHAPTAGTAAVGPALSDAARQHLPGGGELGKLGRDTPGLVFLRAGQAHTSACHEGSTTTPHHTVTIRSDDLAVSGRGHRYRHLVAAPPQRGGCRLCERRHRCVPEEPRARPGAFVRGGKLAEFASSIGLELEAKVGSVAVGHQPGVSGHYRGWGASDIMGDARVQLASSRYCSRASRMKTDRGLPCSLAACCSRSFSSTGTRALISGEILPGAVNDGRPRPSWR